MGVVEIKNYIIGTILFTLMIVGGLYLITELASVDNSFIDDTKYTQFNDSFNKMTELSDAVGQAQSAIDDAETDYGLLGALNSLISTAWNSIRLTFTSFGFMDDIFEATAGFFGVPVFIPQLISMIIVIIIAFAIFDAIFIR